MTLEEKLKTIDKPSVLPLGTGNPASVEELWRTFIEPRLPKKGIVLQWHRVLMEYIRQPDAVFPIRGYYSEAKKINYGRLRRGFLTQTSEGYRFFYTDNYHAAYYLKMALDGFTPSVDELLSAYLRRTFPARFAQDAPEERNINSMPRGKDPRIHHTGYMIAHIFDVGKSYYANGKLLSLSRDILGTYYPRGEREDWRSVCDSTGSYHLRHLDVSSTARKYMVASFLRFVHPFNYFLMPKRTTCTVDISGKEYLIQYVKSKFRELYGSAYDEFLQLIMSVNTPQSTVLDTQLVDYRYGKDTKKTEKKEKRVNGRASANQQLAIIAKAVCVRLEKQQVCMNCKDIIDALATQHNDYMGKKPSLQCALSALRGKGVFLHSTQNGKMEFTPDYWDSKKIKEIRDKIVKEPQKLKFEWVLEELI